MQHIIYRIETVIQVQKTQMQFAKEKVSAIRQDYGKTPSKKWVRQVADAANAMTEQEALKQEKKNIWLKITAFPSNTVPSISMLCLGAGSRSPKYTVPYMGLQKQRR